MSFSPDGEWLAGGAADQVAGDDRIEKRQGAGALDSASGKLRDVAGESAASHSQRPRVVDASAPDWGIAGERTIGDGSRTGVVDAAAEGTPIA